MALDLSVTAKKLIRSLAAKSEDGVFYIVSETGGSEDPDTGEWTPGTTSRNAIDGARVAYNQTLIDGVNIQTGDFQLLIPYDTALPSGCWVEDEQSSYAIVGANAVNHAGKPQLFKLQLRRQ